MIRTPFPESIVADTAYFRHLCQVGGCDSFVIMTVDNYAELPKFFGCSALLSPGIRPDGNGIIGCFFQSVLEYAGKQDGMHRWRCQCDCGQETVVGQTLLQSGKTKSCGCLQKEVYIDNLKLIDGTSVTVLESLKKRTPSNRSGVIGVYQNRHTGKWIAQITFKNKKYHLGTFDILEDAVKARNKARKCTIIF